ncbi:hypothetical protein [Streptacidiphilus cavernicola]|uniref:Uncharacterized protein n=1 Tax=Streptacidiphilus cavernicola TaxID=3342716 RepID=A0ABV6V0J5_9ACTN
MSTERDELDAEIEAWAAAQAAESPSWTAEKWESTLAGLRPGESE